MPHYTDGGISYRVEGNDANTPAGMRVQQALEPVIAQFVQGQRQIMRLGEAQQWANSLYTPLGVIRYISNNGQETVIVTPTIPPSGGGSNLTTGSATVWKIDQNYPSTWPFTWDGTQSTQTIMNGLVSTPSTASVNNAALPSWGTAVMLTPVGYRPPGVSPDAVIPSKQYWEVEIVTLPSSVPDAIDVVPQPTAVDFTAREQGNISPNGQTETSPVYTLTMDGRAQYVWPSDYTSFAQPMIGVCVFAPSTNPNPSGWAGQTSTRLIDTQFDALLAATPAFIGQGVDQKTYWQYWGYYTGPASSASTPDSSQTFLCAPNPVNEANPHDTPAPPSTFTAAGNAWPMSTWGAVGNGSTIYYSTGTGNGVPGCPVLSGPCSYPGPTFGVGGLVAGVTNWINACAARHTAWVSAFNTYMSTMNTHTGRGDIPSTYFSSSVPAVATAVAADLAYTAQLDATKVLMDIRNITLALGNPAKGVNVWQWDNAAANGSGWVGLQQVYAQTFFLHMIAELITAYVGAGASVAPVVPNFDIEAAGGSWYGTTPPPQTHVTDPVDSTVFYAFNPLLYDGAFLAFGYSAIDAWIKAHDAAYIAADAIVTTAFQAIGCGLGIPYGGAYWLCVDVGAGVIDQYGGVPDPTQLYNWFRSGRVTPAPTTIYYGDVNSQPANYPSSYTTGATCLISYPGWSSTGFDLGQLLPSDRIQIAADKVSGNVWFGKNGNWVSGDPSSGGTPCGNVGANASIYACVVYQVGATDVRMHFNSTLAYSAPNGFTPLSESIGQVTLP